MDLNMNPEPTRRLKALLMMKARQKNEENKTILY